MSGVRGLVWGNWLRRGVPLGWRLAPLTPLLPSGPSRWLKLPPLLSSSSVALRILAGETIALVFELAQDMEVRQGAVAVGGSRWAGSRAAGSCWHRDPAPGPAELALMAGCIRLVSPAGAQAEGLAPVIPQPCPGDGSSGQCPELHLQMPLFFWQEDLCHQDTEFLRAQLKVLATESNKYRAKTDRRKQRSIFRDILRFIEVPEAGNALPC